MITRLPPILLFPLAACVVTTYEPNLEHCWHADGDATCRARFASEAPYCTRDTPPCNTPAPFGCTSTLPTPVCHSPCGGDHSALENSSCRRPDGPTTECMLDADCVGVCYEGVCVPCSSHVECPNQAGCDLVIGQCLDPDRVYHVGVGYDYADVAEAVTVLGVESGTIIVHPTEDSNFGPEIAIDPAQSVVLRASAEDSVELHSPAYIFAVSGRLFLEHLTLRGGGGFHVQGGVVQGRGIVVAATSEHAAECVSGGVYLENSMLIGAPVLTAAAAPLSIHEDCRVELVSSSVFSQHGPALECPAGLAREGSMSRKSLLVAYDDIAVDCAMAELAGTAQTEYTDVDVDVFVAPFEGDLHLVSAVDLDGLLVDDWLPGDPMFDIDGQRREPFDYVGADVPVMP